MVLQRDASDPVWGWTTPGDTVTVAIKDQNGSTLETQSAVADSKGRWQTNVGPYGLVENNAAYSMVISAPGQNTMTLTDILIGDVWLCTGQSNMANTLKSTPVTNWEAEAADSANYPNIRCFSVPVIAATTPQDIIGTGQAWLVSNATNTQSFSAVAYFMARELYKRQGVPIGILTSTRGSTVIQTWSSPETATNFADLAQEAFDTWTQPPVVGKVSQLYNGMIYPLAPFRLRGVNWYQGESNSGAPEQYSRLLPAMMASWRSLFGQPDLPFVITEIANFNTVQSSPVETGSWAELRESQQQVVTTDGNASFAATNDIGDVNTIHPPDKQDTGLRAARAILQKVFAEDIVGQGPVFTNATIEDVSIRCSFSNVGNGLMVGQKTPDPLTPAQEVVGGTLSGFAIAGANKVFVAANALIDPATNTVVVSSPSVSAPLYVRYGWATNPVCNLYNKITDGSGNVVDGIPAAPFRNDPVYKLNVTSGTGTGFYALNSTQTITAATISGLTFDHWMGDTDQLASATNATTTATVSGKYVAVAATYQVSAAPANLHETAITADGISLAWQAMTNVHYNIKRATSAGGVYSIIATNLSASTTAFTDSDVTIGSTYHYKISATGLLGEGPDSTSLAVAVPVSVLNLQAAPGNAHITLTWDAFDGAISYSIKRDTGTGIFSTIATGITPLGYTDRSIVSDTTYSYKVSATTASGESPDSFEVSARPSFIAPPLQDVDIGSVGIAGSSYASSTGTYTVTGSGEDIFGGSTDSFHFTYQPITGDSTVTVRLKTQQAISNISKAGLMIREDFSTTAKQISLMATPGAGNRLIYRTSTTGNPTVSAPAFSIPAWIRIQRAGNLFTVTRSSDGNTWITVGSATISMASTVYAGMAVTSHDNSQLGNATFDNLTALGDQAPGAPSGLSASVTPISHQATIKWDAAAGAAQGYNVKRSTSNGGPYATIAGPLNATSYTDTTLSDGTTYYYVVSALGVAGESPNSDQTTVDLTPPVVTTPSSVSTQATSSSGANVTFSTSASDNIDGPISTTNFPASGSVFPIGNTTVTASATDSAGNSTAETFTVSVVWPTPANFSAAPVSETQVELTWEADSINGAPFTVQRSLQGANAWITLTTSLAADSTSYLDSTASSSTSYDYRIESSGSGVSSSPASFSASTPAGIGDGIPGSWRYEYFGNGLTVTPESDTHADPDGDGMDNLQEYLSGTVPTNFASALRTSLNISGTDITVSFPSVSGKIYILQKTTSLEPTTSWAALQDDISGTDDVVSVTDSGALTSQAKSFYRVMVK